jgi:hypothetical protein
MTSIHFGHKEETSQPTPFATHLLVGTGIGFVAGCIAAATQTEKPPIIAASTVVGLLCGYGYDYFSGQEVEKTGDTYSATIVE